MRIMRAGNWFDVRSFVFNAGDRRRTNPVPQQERERSVTYPTIRTPLRWLLVLNCIAGCDMSSAALDHGAKGQDVSEASEGPPGQPNSDGKSSAEASASDSGEPPGEPAAAPADSRPARSSARRARPAPEPESEPDAAPEPEPEPVAVMMPDLRLEARDADRAVSFRQQMVIDDSCERVVRR